jgi:uncharacterized protein (TIGR02452 family)
MLKQTSKPGTGDRRSRLRNIAAQTLEVVEIGTYTLPNASVSHDLRAKIESLKTGTIYYPADSHLSTWSVSHPQHVTPTPVQISIIEKSTIEGARALSSTLTSQSLTDKIGLLNFASTKKPGGGFINGAQA